MTPPDQGTATVPPGNRPALGKPWQSEFLAWWADAKPLWIYIFKMVLACILALLLSMRLDLPQPRTAMITVCILMQPQSGLVLAKSVYRFFSTVLGLVAMMVLISIFSQQPVLYLGALSLWICFCTVGAARNRNFRSYGFVLAGYTAALIGIPSGQQPDGAFITAMTRVAETTVGILCAGAVSALVLPKYVSSQIKIGMQRRFEALSNLLSTSLLGKVTGAELALTHISFLEQVIALESARSVGVFELPDTRMRSRRLARANIEFMNVATRLHVLHKQWDLIKEHGSSAEVESFHAIIGEIATLLKVSNLTTATSTTAQDAEGRLLAFHARLPATLERNRAVLAGTETNALYRFDAFSEQLKRFTDDLIGYVRTYTSLDSHRHARERWKGSFIPKTSLTAALVSGFRAGLVTSLLSVFWIKTAWPSGGMMVLSASAVCALGATSPQPVRFARQMCVGTIIAVVLGALLQFGIYPRIDGFPLLACAIIPFMTLGAYLTSKPATMGIGMGFCIFFCLVAGPDLTTRYDPYQYLNEAVAIEVAMLVVWCAFAIILPSNGSWLRRILLRQLREQIVLVCEKNHKHLAMRFESAARDTVAQMNAYATPGSGRQETARWLLFVLSVGRTILDIKEELASGKNAAAEFHPKAELVLRISSLLEVVSTAFCEPNDDRVKAVAAALDRALSASGVLNTDLPMSDDVSARFGRIRHLLEFLKATLLTGDSPFRLYVIGQHAIEHPTNQGS